MMSGATQSERRLIQKRVLIQASPEIVYGALTAAKELEIWFCDRAVSDCRAGGELKAQWRRGRSVEQGRAIFSILVPFSEVALEWVDDGDGKAGGIRHELSYHIRPLRFGCELIMRDEGRPLPDEETLEILDEGWVSVLMDLKEHCEAKDRSLRLSREREASTQ
jgi:uncharacterized protein YndB with AHSA1/START domain